MSLVISDRQYYALLRCVDAAKMWHQHIERDANAEAIAERKDTIENATHGIDVLKMQRIRDLKDQKRRKSGERHEKMAAGKVRNIRDLVRET